MNELLRRPEYVHVVLNHLPLVGLGVAALALAIALLSKSRAATVGCLVLVLVTAASVWAVVESGESAYNRIRAIADPDGAPLLKHHMEAADRWVWLYYASALLAAIALAVNWKKPKWTMPVGIAVVVLSLAATVAGISIAQLGGEVRHPEFRPGADVVPQNVPEGHEHGNNHQH